MRTKCAPSTGPCVLPARRPPTPMTCVGQRSGGFHARAALGVAATDRRGRVAKLRSRCGPGAQRAEGQRRLAAPASRCASGAEPRVGQRSGGFHARAALDVAATDRRGTVGKLPRNVLYYITVYHRLANHQGNGSLIRPALSGAPHPQMSTQYPR